MITTNYIKMCEKAKEIQDNWIPKKGDSFLAEYTIWNIGESYIGEDTREPVAVIFPKKYNRESNIESPKIWLPTQEDLQKIFYRNNSYSWWGMLDLFHEWTLNERNKKDPSIKQLWLMFVMKEKYHKIWNGKNWRQNES